MVATERLAEKIIARLEARAHALTDVPPRSWLRFRATLEEFFEVIEATEDQPYDLEFEEGIILARMRYATATHELIVANLLTLLGNFYRNDTTVGVYGSSRLVYVPGYERVYNPDVVAVNQPEAYFPNHDRPLTITNATIVIEVHSNSTEGYDYAHKLMCYKQLPSVRHILYISPLKPFVTAFSRTDEPQIWLNADYGKLELEIDLGELQLPMREVYRKVVFGESTNAGSAS